MHRFSFTKKTAYYHNIKFGIFIKEGRQCEKESNIALVFKDGTILSKEIMKERNFVQKHTMKLTTKIRTNDGCTRLCNSVDLEHVIL
jgi:hypothetical protein